MPAISVLGATGFIGRRVFRKLRARAGPGWIVTGTGLRGASGPGITRLDLTDPAALREHLRQGFDEIVFLAGTKDVASCERDPRRAMALNAEPVEAALEALRRDGLPTRVTYLSTDYVFDGTRGRYGPGDEPAPRTAYGRSKRRGELAVLGAASHHRVVRSGAVLGRGSVFCDWFLSELEAGREVALFEDCASSPTPVEYLADLLVSLLLVPRPAERIVHFVGGERMTRLELGRRLARALGLQPSLRAASRRAEEGAYFQQDLSLIPSALSHTDALPDFDAYIRQEFEAR